MKNPIQPLIKGDDGIVRFKSNKMVGHLLDWAQAHGHGLNEMAIMPFSNDDRQQFAQLIGYSLCGFSELDYVDDDAYNAAEEMKPK